MKLLTLSDRLWGLGMTTAVYGAVVPALLMLGAGLGKAPAHPGTLRTFDVAIPQPEPVSEELSRRRPADRVYEHRQPSEASRNLPAPAPSASPGAVPPPPVAAPQPAEINIPARSTLPPPVPEPGPAKPAMILNDYAVRLWSHIASHRPPGIRLEGTTTVIFDLTRTGELRNASIAERSGNPMLDRLALRTVRGAAPFPAPPEALDDGQLRFTIPFSFR